VDDALAQLVHAELIFRRGTPPDAEYTFKHALVQEAAYSTLLRARRQQLHGRISAVLESQFPEVPKNRPELLAHHCAEAGLSEKAIDYYLEGSQRATAASNNTEASRHLAKALALLHTLPPSAPRTKELRERITIGGWWWSV
jgi:predicted ATPase